jgi:hypothetical protein
LYLIAGKEDKMKKTLMLTLLFWTAIGIAQAQKLEIIAPNGGETLVSGMPLTITWSFSGLKANETMVIALEGATDYGPIAYSKVSAGSFDWLAGKKMDGTFAKPASDYRILIELVDSDMVYDASDATFTIAPAPSIIALMTPNGGETLQKRTDFTINWSCSGKEGFVNLVLVKDEQPLGLIAENLPATSLRYIWHVGSRLLNGLPYPEGNTYRIQIQWQLSASTSAASLGNLPAKAQPPVVMGQNNDRSDGVFSIMGIDKENPSYLEEKKR